MGLHSVKITTDENGRSFVKIDGKEIRYVHSASAFFKSGCFPTVEIETYGIDEIETSAFVEFSFSPETAQRACAVINTACKNDETFRKAMLASIRASLHGYVLDCDLDALAESVLDGVFIGI